MVMFSLLICECAFDDGKCAIDWRTRRREGPVAPELDISKVYRAVRVVNDVTQRKPILVGVHQCKAERLVSII